LLQIKETKSHNNIQTTWTAKTNPSTHVTLSGSARQFDWYFGFLESLYGYNFPFSAISSRGKQVADRWRLALISLYSPFFDWPAHIKLAKEQVPQLLWFVCWSFQIHPQENIFKTRYVWKRSWFVESFRSMRYNISCF
jgi:hypothetical protein